MDPAFPRHLADEILDHLAPDDPRAVRARKDLRRINRIMGSARIIGRALAQSGRPLVRIIELGAGDGALMLQLAQRLAPRSPQAHVTLLDRQALVPAEVRAGLAALGWTPDLMTTDVADWIAGPDAARADLAISNLFIHHLDAAALRKLFAALAARVDMFVACEPRRGRLALSASRLVGLLGANAVTRTDAVLSVQAGFRDNELSAYWPDQDAWELEERRAGLFSHLFVATRRGGHANRV
jgi:hypothetical protein